MALWYVFRSKTEDGTSQKSSESISPRFDNSSSDCLREAGEGPPDNAGEDSTASQGKFGQLMSLKIVHLLSAFIIVYVGTEVTIGGMSRTIVRLQILRF